MLGKHGTITELQSALGLFCFGFFETGLPPVLQPWLTLNSQTHRALCVSVFGVLGLKGMHYQLEVLSSKWALQGSPCYLKLHFSLNSRKA